MIRWSMALIPMLLAAACGGESAREPGTGTPADTAVTTAPAMRMPSMDMLPGVRAYLDTIARAEPADLAQLVAGHGGRMTRMLTAMDQDMRAMAMAADAAWRMLSDSIRADVAALPGLSGETLVLRMQAHAGRMRRLLERHAQMMGSMDGMR